MTEPRLILDDAAHTAAMRPSSVGATAMYRAALASTLTICGLSQLPAFAAQGAIAPYNEAVRIVSGQRVVDVSPFPAHMKHALAYLKRPEQYPTNQSVASIETQQGLMDCVGTLWYHPQACSRSTFGKQVLDRTWVVEMNGRWFTCATYTSAKSCVPLISDGTLRPIPSSQE